MNNKELKLMSIHHHIPPVPFNQWVLERENRQVLFVAGFILTILFGVFKLFYPYPNFISPDSESYIEAAGNNHLINFWAIGYSKFLRLFSCFTKSDFLLVLFQYLLLQSSILYFLFSLAYCISIRKRMFRILIGLNILNPLLLHISNFVSSDSLFITFSLLWFTQLIWILFKPTWRLMLLHAMVVLLAFMMRYSALYYPFISVVIIVIAQSSTSLKCMGIGCIIFLLASFIIRTQYQYYKQTSTLQYSAFGGWQLAANALYGYAHAKKDPVEVVPERFRPLHEVVNRHMDSLRRLTHRPDEDIEIYYLWNEKAPLKMFADNRWKHDSSVIGVFNRWAAMGPLYGDYGHYLILQHPWPFVKYFVWPNLSNYYVPPSGFMGLYNFRGKTVPLTVATWFGWKDNKVRTYFKDPDIDIVECFCVLSGTINLTFLIGFVCFGFIRNKAKTSNCNRVLWLTGLVWGSNMVFSVLASPVELRYQLFPMIITFTVSILVIGLGMQKGQSTNL